MILSAQQVFDKLSRSHEGGSLNRFAMYSSWLGGIVKDPGFMFVPVDDHIVHRGDGVFEAFRINGGCIYDLDSHLKRLVRSADFIGLELPFELSRIREIIIETARASEKKEAIVRLYVSRGPGGFTANPYECLGSQLYVVVTPFKKVAPELYSDGGIAGVSSIAPKGEPWSQVKSCNYLQNVMMKKEVVEKNWNFSFSLREGDFVCEGATENLAIVSRGSLLVPRYDYTLKGTTLERVIELARKDLNKLQLKSVVQTDIHVDKVLSADEVFFVGTTIEVAPITSIQYKGSVTRVADGKVGKIATSLRQLLISDMQFNENYKTEV